MGDSTDLGSAVAALGPTTAAPPSAFDIQASARRIGHYEWIEARLFEVLGTWVASVPELEAKMLLATHSHHHAWHAELWHQRLPELRELPPDDLVAAPSDGVERFFDCLAAPARPEQTIEKVVGVYRVLIPHKIAAYTFHLDHTSRVADGPTVRALRLIVRDETDDWYAGERLVQSLLSGPDDVRRAADRQAELETLLVDAGGVVGPGSVDANPAPRVIQ